jgi:hypothetical protein
MDVTHWPWGRICVTDLSADRKAVRIAKGYLSFITKGAEVGARANGLALRLGVVRLWFCGT